MFEGELPATQVFFSKRFSGYCFRRKIFPRGSRPLSVAGCPPIRWPIGVALKRKSVFGWQAFLPNFECHCAVAYGHCWQQKASLIRLSRTGGLILLSPRHFVRRFNQDFGGTPAKFAENLRLDEARRCLTERTQTIDSVAAFVGFRSDDSFRRAFQRHFGVKLSSYRNSFNACRGDNATRERQHP
jgi:AraC-like DNA-binding protein